MTRPVVVLTRKWTENVERALAERFALRAHPRDELLSAEAILGRCDGADILCPAANPVDAELINALPDSVRLIANFGAGIDHMDLGAAKARGIMVSNTPEVVTEEVADLAFGLVIAACRRFHESNELVRTDAWPRGVMNIDLGQRVWGQTLGIVGLGRIGGAIARRAQGFRMSIIYHNRRRNADAEVAYGARYAASLEDLVTEADIVVLATPGGSETHHLINARTLRLMKPTAVLINVGRGPSVDEAALAKALAAGTIAAAGIDVHEFEPEVSAEMRRLPNAFMLTHIGTGTTAGRDAMGFRVMQNIEAFLAAGEPLDRVA